MIILQILAFPIHLLQEYNKPWSDRGKEERKYTSSSAMYKYPNLHNKHNPSTFGVFFEVRSCHNGHAAGYIPRVSQLL